MEFSEADFERWLKALSASVTRLPSADARVRSFGSPLEVG